MGEPNHRWGNVFSTVAQLDMNLASASIHFVAADQTITWWAESGELPALSAAADSLAELRELLGQAILDISSEVGESIVVVSERLAVDAEEPLEVAHSLDRTSAKHPFPDPSDQLAGYWFRSSPMEITSAILCDFAQVRENLLFVA